MTAPASKRADSSTALAETERLLQQARDAVRLRDEFIGIASHELKTPLTPLLLQIETLARSVERGQERADTLRGLARASAQVKRLSQLVDDLLDLSRLAEGRLELTREEVDLGKVSREVLDMFEQELRRSGSTSSLRVEAPVAGRWDRRRVRQVVSHLLANAVKYGEGKPIEIELGEEEGRARLVVRDHGMGIPPADQARIFERFGRAASVRHFGGFGLGLWVVREIVEAHGGRVHLRSVPGEGSTFTVLLPR